MLSRIAADRRRLEVLYLQRRAVNIQRTNGTGRDAQSCARVHLDVELCQAVGAEPYWPSCHWAIRGIWGAPRDVAEG